MNKNITTLLIAVLVICGVGAAVLFLRGDEDTWLCENGAWVQHGNPAADHPLTGCGDLADLTDTNAAPPRQYAWSTMPQGPYHDSISYAISIDLLHWTDSGTLLAEHASVPGAMMKDGVVFVYFVDVTTDGVPEKIGLMRSSDGGVTWTERQFVEIDGLGDVVPVDPAPVVLDDGRVRLYYLNIAPLNGPLEGITTTDIHSAISSDGVHFTQEDGIRYASIGGFDPDVEKQGDIWRMYVGDLAGNAVISATSPDGLTFTTETTTPNGEAYIGGAVPDVFKSGDTYYLFTAGINIATSSDGVTFSNTGMGFRGAGVTADPSVVEIADGTYMMLYKTQAQR